MNADITLIKEARGFPLAVLDKLHITVKEAVVQPV